MQASDLAEIYRKDTEGTLESRNHSPKRIVWSLVLWLTTEMKSMDLLSQLYNDDAVSIENDSERVWTIVQQHLERLIFGNVFESLFSLDPNTHTEDIEVFCSVSNAERLIKYFPASLKACLLTLSPPS